jgi:hypothetical protein
MESNVKIERGEIEVDSRHTARGIRTAIQGNVIRALTELITNADDSYTRLESENKPAKGIIEIEYKKERYGCEFTVRDFAEGMSVDGVRLGFTHYGASTSGLSEGKRVRGYFGQGAKDALASMKDGKICTFKDDSFVECRLYIENGKPRYEIIGPNHETQVPRYKHKIHENGTVAYFKNDPNQGVKTPQFDTVHEQLANNYLLRKIMTNPKRKITLLNKNSTEIREIKYLLPPGKKILSERFSIPFKKYDNFPILITIFRADNELTQAGDDRAGGLLIIDEAEAVLDISLFKFDNEPFAARFFGEVTIEGFRKLLENEETVLSEERNGLQKRHPFCVDLINEIEKRLAAKVNEERARKQQEERKMGDKELLRYKKSFDFLNKIAEEEIQEAINLGDIRSKEIEAPPNGMCIYPSSAQITVEKRYNFQLWIDTKKITFGSLIKVESSKSKIQVISPEIEICESDGEGVIRKSVTIIGREPNIAGRIFAKFRNIFTEANVSVIPEKEFLLSEGLIFQPESITLHPNRTRKVYLIVNLKKISVGNTIKIISDNDTIKISPTEVIVAKSSVVNDLAKFELDIWGEGIGQHAMITAQHGESMSFLGVSITAKEETTVVGRKGMFSNEPEYNFDLEPTQRAHYSKETGKVIIYVNFPTIKYYVGKNLEYIETLPAQILLSDIIAEKCFYEIAKNKVEQRAALINPDGVYDNIQREANLLSKKHGKTFHELSVDQNMIDAARNKHLGNFGEADKNLL